MNYLLTRFNCCVKDNVDFNLIKDVKYCLNLENKSYLLFSDNGFPMCVNFFNNKNVLKVETKKNCYYILNNSFYTQPCIVKIKYLNFEIFVMLFNKLTITINGESVLDLYIEDLTYSTYEEYNKFLIIYFSGKRNYVVVIQNDKLVYSNYYDECNLNDKEKIFMCKCNDILNHGKVFKLYDGNFEEYLVYLDNYDLNLNSRFIGYVFLDCLIAKNYKYCNNLLSKDIKQNNAEQIKDFFPEFDYYIEDEINEFILINKNTLAGIYKFEIDNLSIVNIIQLNP